MLVSHTGVTGWIHISGSTLHLDFRFHDCIRLPCIKHGVNRIKLPNYATTLSFMKIVSYELELEYTCIRHIYALNRTYLAHFVHGHSVICLPSVQGLVYSDSLS